MSNGIDVSVYQGDINWKKVKASGIEFAIIRAGYGKSTVDKCFDKNIEGALAAGLKVGVYWFIYALNRSDLLLNAAAFKKAIDPYKANITMKVWCDFEYDTDTYANKKGVTFSKSERTEYVQLFCETMKDYGYDAGVYANPDYLKNKFNDLSEYPLWLAYYASSKGKYEPFMWQHSSKGSVTGISGNVDLNICYGEASNNEPSLENPYPVPTRNLKKTFPCMRGDDVKWLQWELVQAGYMKFSDIDGIFGNQTKNAVISYQKAHGLVADGIVGVKTRNSLINN